MQFNCLKDREGEQKKGYIAGVGGVSCHVLGCPMADGQVVRQHD